MKPKFQDRETSGKSLLIRERKEILDFMVLEVAFRSSAYLRLVLATNFPVAYLHKVANGILGS